MGYTADGLKKEYKKNYHEQHKKNLIRLREEIAKMSLTEFSKNLGIQKANLSSLEHGDRDLSLFNIQAYKKFFLEKYNIDISTDYLLGYTNNMYADDNYQIASQMTGLSDKSIEVLKKFNRKSWLRHYIEPLNYILESEQYTEFANLLYMYFNDSFYVPLRFDPDTGDFVPNVTPGFYYSDNSYANVIPIGSPIENNSGYEVSFVETTSFMNAYLLQEMQNILKVIKEKER